MNNLLRRNGFCGIGQKDVGQKNVLLLVLAALILTGEARGGTVVSNLGEADQDNVPIDNSLWFASLFRILSDEPEYRLDSGIAPFEKSFGTVSNFSLSIYSDSGTPGEELEVLSGGVPSTAGNHEFTSSGLLLNAGSYYWMVFKSFDTAGTLQGLVTPNKVASSDGNWILFDESWGSFDQGASWGGAQDIGASYASSSLVYSIQATPVPEPHEYAVFAGVGLIAFGVIRRRMKGAGGATLASC